MGKYSAIILTFLLIVSAPVDAQQFRQVQVPYQTTEMVRIPGTGWAQGRTSCGNARCSMCYPQFRRQVVTRYRTVNQPVFQPQKPVVRNITEFREVPAAAQRIAKSENRKTATATDATPRPPSGVSQAALRDDVIAESLELLFRDVDEPEEMLFADIGSGDGRVLIAAVQLLGCRAVGVEIDPVKAAESRYNVAKAEAAKQIPIGRIDIITGDAHDFNPEAHGVDRAVAFLYLDLLGELAPMLSKIPKVVAPFHDIPGLTTQQHKDLYLYSKGGFAANYDEIYVNVWKSETPGKCPPCDRLAIEVPKIRKLGIKVVEYSIERHALQARSQGIESIPVVQICTTSNRSIHFTQPPNSKKWEKNIVGFRTANQIQRRVDKLIKRLGL